MILGPWWRGSIRTRLLVAALCVEAVMLTLLVANSVRLLYDSLASQARLHAEQVAPVLNAALVAPLAQRDYATLQAILSESHAVEGIEYLAVTDNRGKVVAVSGWPAATALPEPDAGFSLAARDGVARYDVRRPIALAGQTLGVLQFGLNLRHIVEARRTLVMQGVGIALGEMAMSTALLIALGLWLTRSLLALTRASEAVAGGRALAVPVPAGDDEVGRLGRAFNTMIGAIDERVGQLRETLRQKAEATATLDRERARMLSLLSAMEFGVLFVDPDGLVSYANPAAGDLLGLSADPVGRPLAQSLAGLAPEQARALCVTGEAGEFRRDDGRIITCRSFPVQDSQGPAGRLWTFLDVSASRLAAQQLRAAKEAAEAANQAKATFLATMSHEVRTPMNGVIGMTGLLLDTALTPEQTRFAHTIRDCADSLLTVINDILDFSKMEAGKLDIDFTDFQLAALVESVVGILAPRAQAKGIALDSQVAPEAWGLLRGDGGRLRQILMNLVGNGVKFTHDGGVAIKVECQDREGDEMLVRFEVRDTGIGIPAEAGGQLFGMFSQVDASTARRYGGTGLGLAISKRLVEMMGGAIGFDSEPGRGSRFWFTVPLRVVGTPVAPTAAPLPAPVAAGRRLRILVAEDNRVNQQVARGLLRKLGHAVDVVADGVEAVQAVRALPYDLVLMDVQMPEMDGLEATAAIRRLPGPVARVPIVAMTANAMRGDDRTCLAAGLDGYVSKPIDRHKLMEVVGRVAAGPPSAAVAAVAAAEAAGFVDPTTLDNLRQELGDVGVAALLANFQADAATRLRAIRAALACGDEQTVRRQGHAIKGAAANLGLLAVREAAQAMEQGDASAPERLAEMLAGLPGWLSAVGNK